ncbi:MAG TPA: thiamine phosphate synthase [Methanofollis liminatans]|uniref:Thiamine-phosphate synthase n=1 Tax=Methanofollis liminatans TaxID=2201 RepID=A0A831PLJ6_9EURY|nr:thiamine phosphate synthase [Methanofollis liminatans]
MGYDLYVITDAGIGRGRSHPEQARLAVEGGADVVQLRDKALAPRDLLATAREVRRVVHAAGALFIVNDHLEIALSAGADGVHLGQGDLPVGAARAVVPSEFILGVSVGNTTEAALAVEGGADYVALSPTFATGSKADAGPGRGLDILRAVRAAVPVPLLAIGGIGPANVGEVVRAGADGVAVISAVVGQEDAVGAARRMKALIAAAKGGERRC